LLTRAATVRERVVEAEEKPEKALNAFKSYASRRLNESGVDGEHRKRWTRHGSTRWLMNRDAVDAAVRYGAEGQGEPMAVFEA
jgi:hypothetical protein